MAHHVAVAVIKLLESIDIECGMYEYDSGTWDGGYEVRYGVNILSPGVGEVVLGITSVCPFDVGSVS